MTAPTVLGVRPEKADYRKDRGTLMAFADFVALAASIATVVAAVAVVVAAIIYNGQLKAMKKARELESLLVIMSSVDNLALRKTRFFMMRHGAEVAALLQDPYTWEVREEIDTRVRELSSGELGVDDVDLAINGLNNICFLVRDGYAPPMVVRSFMRNSLLHAWSAFESYVKQRQNVSDGVADSRQYGSHLERVVRVLCT